MNRYFKFIHFQFYFCNIFFTRGDLNFDWLFFIKLIWWNRTCPIFSKFDQTNLIKQKCVKFCCIHYLINFFDSINFMKLIWPCISSFRTLFCTIYLKNYFTKKVSISRVKSRVTKMYLLNVSRVMSQIWAEIVAVAYLGRCQTSLCDSNIRKRSKLPEIFQKPQVKPNLICLPAYQCTPFER